MLYKHKISLILDSIKKNGVNESIMNKLRVVFKSNLKTKKKLIKSVKNIKYCETKILHQVLEIFDINVEKYLKDKKPYITKDEIKEMIDDGFYFGGHTMSHKPLQKLCYDEQKGEIINSIEWLKKNFGITYSLFAFPFSDKDISKKLISDILDYDKNIVLFGNSGIKKDISNSILQRFSLEIPTKKIERLILTENLYKFYNKLIGKYKIRRK